MKKKISLVGLFLVLVLSLFLSACSSGKTSQSGEQPGEKSGETKKKIPTNLSFGTNPQGTAYNASATGVAGLLSEHSSVHISVSPYSGPNTYLPMVNDGEMDLALATSPTLKWAFEGDGGYENKNTNLRTILRGNLIDGAILVARADSGVKTTADLRGKRVASDFGAHKHIAQMVEVQLKSAGLTWDDVIPVPVSGTGAGEEALRDGRVDATFGGSLSAANTMENDASFGLNIINVADIAPEDIDKFPEDVLNDFREFVPGFQVTAQKGGIAEEEVTLTQYPIYFLASKEMSEDLVYEILDIIWEKYEELHGVHAWLKGWNKDGFLDETPATPYHEGAVRFFKDKGVWNDVVEKNHQALLEKDKN
jgi:uncharacterized protein